jgi:hypothetical protein
LLLIKPIAAVKLPVPEAVYEPRAVPVQLLLVTETVIVFVPVQLPFAPVIV